MRRLVSYAVLAGVLGTAACAVAPPGSSSASATPPATPRFSGPPQGYAGQVGPSDNDPPPYYSHAYYIPDDLGPPIVYAPRAVVRGYWVPRWRGGSW